MSSERAEIVLPLSDVGAPPPPAPRVITIPLAPPADGPALVAVPAPDATPESISEPVLEHVPDPVDVPVDESLDGSRDEPLDGRAPVEPPDSTSLDSLLGYAVRAGASDLVLTAHNSPAIRVQGQLSPIPGCPPLDGESIESMLESAAPGLLGRFTQSRQTRFAHTAEGRRFRVEVFQQRSTLGATIRVLPPEPPELSSLRLASILDHIAELQSGLVIIGSPVGSGRSTTAAAVIAAANRLRRAHIVTIEDPIEVVHSDGTCVVSQRELGVDIASTSDGLESAGRVGADIVMVGDLGVSVDVEQALAAAESGLLVIATATMPTARGVVERLVEGVDAARQPQVRARLAKSLQAVVCQVLCPPVHGGHRIPATEVLVATEGVRDAIRDGRFDLLTQSMIEGKKVEMHTLNQDLSRLVRDGFVSADAAFERCSDATELRRYLAAVG